MITKVAIRTLKTPRLVLRPLAITDAGRRFEVFSDPQTCWTAGVDVASSLPEMARATNALIVMTHQRLAFHWAIDLVESGRCIGFCDIHAPAPAFMAWKEPPRVRIVVAPI